MRTRSDTALTRYAVAIVSILAGTLGRMLLDPVLGTRFPFATLSFAVLFAAWFGGFGPALLAAALGCFLSAWILLPPRFALAVANAMDQHGLVLYAIVSVGIALIGGAMRRARQQAEASATAAATQGEQLRVTLESIGDAVITTDTRARITSMNAVAGELTGWSAEEAAGRPLGDVFRIVNEETRAPAPNPVDRALAEGRVVGLANHTLLLARDGTARPIDDSAAPIRNRAGTTIGAVLVFRDVTASRRAQERLRRSEQDLSDFFENANVGLHFVDPDGIILRANQTELELLGYERAEYVGRHIAEFHVDQNAIADILRRLAAGETLQHYPARMRCKDGSVKEVLINASVRWEDDRFVHTRCFTLDVTTRRRGEEARALLAAVVESSEDAIVTKTLEGIVTSWNGGAERLFGYRASETIGQPITMIIPPERHAEERAILARLRVGERVEHFETVRRARDGRLLNVSLTVSPVRDPSGRIIGASKVARDITDRKRVEEALVAADRRKDTFLAVLAHELRNPMAPLRNSLEIVKHAAGNATLMAQAQATMDRQLAHLARLVDDLVDVARISRDQIELRRESVELASIIHHAIETCRPLAETRGLELTVTPAPAPIYLEADPVRLAQVFSNLLINACKYGDPGGHVAIEARREGAEAVVAVRDDGLGIPADMLATVFDMFTQLGQAPERTQSGLGIGLTLVRRLVEMHGGTVEARSDGPGRGSEFVVRLPAAARPAARPAPPPADGVPAARRRILIVDDNADAAESLAMLLEMQGHETHLAYDGGEALEAAARLRPDVAILDIGLPTTSGHEVARRLRAEEWGRTMILVALTGWGQQEEVNRSRTAGFDHHLVKPVDVAALTCLLAEAPSTRTHPGDSRVS